MAIEIISVKEKQGNFEGKDYHNFNIFGVIRNSDNKQVIAGVEIEEMKIKADNFVSALHRNIGMLNNPKVQRAQDIVGLYIIPSYNKYGQCLDFTLVIPEKTK